MVVAQFDWCEHTCQKSDDSMVSRSREELTFDMRDDRKHVRAGLKRGPHSFAVTALPTHETRIRSQDTDCSARQHMHSFLTFRVALGRTSLIAIGWTRVARLRCAQNALSLRKTPTGAGLQPRVRGQIAESAAPVPREVLAPARANEQSEVVCSDSAECAVKSLAGGRAARLRNVVASLRDRGLRERTRLRASRHRFCRAAKILSPQSFFAIDDTRKNVAEFRYHDG